MKLLSTGNPKTLKGESKGFMTYILHLAPADLSGYNTCPKASAGCKSSCLNTAGRGGMFKKGESTNVIQKARIRKTKLFFENREEFMVTLVADIQKAIKQAARKGYTAVFRLNGTSDLAWEKYLVPGTEKNIFDTFDSVQFYDYTAIMGRKVSQYKNYHLTFSAKEDNQKDVDRAIAAGMNVSMVFDKLPSDYNGTPVIDADEHDLRFIDPKGVICGLKAKGKAKKDSSGFVRRMIPLTVV